MTDSEERIPGKILLQHAYYDLRLCCCFEMVHKLKIGKKLSSISI
jgi:hypothetical protein